MTSAKFALGRVFSTPSALDALENAEQTPACLLARHATGDWGEVDVEDKSSNDEALITGMRLLSAYTLPNDTRIWVITEAADENGLRVATTILLPEEY